MADAGREGFRNVSSLVLLSPAVRWNLRRTRDSDAFMRSALGFVCSSQYIISHSLPESSGTGPLLLRSRSR